MNDIPQYKYFKTFHLPWSLGLTNDDKALKQKDLEQHFYPMTDAFISIKGDGENTTIGKGYSHARSLDSAHHWSRNHIKQLAANLYKDIEPGWRICGENMLAQHSIAYDNLPSFFLVFSVWDANNNRLSLDEMIEYCDFLDLHMVPIIKRGPFRQFYFKDNFGLDLEKDEGYVVANSKSFHYDNAKNNMAKFVRTGHVQTDEHWMHGPEIRNKLA